MIEHFEKIQFELKKILRKSPFFIVGCFKSGTTWLQHILNGHPDIASNGESCFFNILRQNVELATSIYSDQQKAGNVNRFTEENKRFLLLTAIAVVVRNWPNIHNASCFVDKDPMICKHIDFLNEIFPHAKLIHIVRDGRDVAVSSWYHQRRQNQPPVWFEKFQDDFPGFVEYWTRHMWMFYTTKAMEFGINNPGRYFEIRYEDLVNEPHTELCKLLEFMNVNRSNSVIEKCLSAGNFSKFSDGRVTGDEDRNSFYRKGVCGDWEHHFDDDMNRNFCRNAGKIMEIFGYCTNPRYSTTV